MRRWIEELSPRRFALYVISFFAVLIAWTWSYAAPRGPEPQLRGDQTRAVPTEVTMPRVMRP